MSKNNAIAAAAEMSKQPATAQVFRYIPVWPVWLI